MECGPCVTFLLGEFSHGDFWQPKIKQISLDIFMEEKAEKEGPACFVQDTYFSQRHNDVRMCFDGVKNTSTHLSFKFRPWFCTSFLHYRTKEKCNRLQFCLFFTSFDKYNNSLYPLSTISYFLQTNCIWSLFRLITAVDRKRLLSNVKRLLHSVVAISRRIETLETRGDA